LIDKHANAGSTSRDAGWAGKTRRGEYIGLLPDDDWLYPDNIDVW